MTCTIEKNKQELLKWVVSKAQAKVKSTVEVSPTKFLDTSLDLNNCIYDFKVYRKTMKQPTHWSLKSPKR